LRIAVVGTGHVGLISCVTFAHIGHEVVGIDADGAKIETLKAGRSPFFEPGVQELLDEGIANGRLRFTSDYSEGIPGADAAFICVGTPPRAGYWPNSSAEEAEAMNATPKYVASTTLQEPLEWSNSTLLKGDIAEEVNKLKQQPGNDLNVVGSGEFAQTLIQLDLVDEYQLMIHPVVVGSGKRLFDGGLPIRALELVDTRTTGTGVVILTYRPAEKKPAESPS